MNINLDLAKLSAEQLVRIQELEKQLNAAVVAYQQPVKLAKLDPDQLAQLQSLEKELGAVLIAFRPQE